jgi:pantetheine-phosphate adenylyltransferase
MKKTPTLVLLIAAVCSTLAVAAESDPATKQLQVYPKNLARQHLGANLLVFNAKNQAYVPTEAAAAWLDDDATTGWPALPGKQHYLVALPEPEFISNFSLSSQPSTGTVTLYAGDEPAIPGAKSWSPLTGPVAIDSVNDKKLASPFSRLAKYVLIETNIADPGPIYSLNLYGDKPASSYSLRKRAQTIDSHAIFGQYVNQKTAFNLNGIYAQGRVTYANSPDGFLSWQKGIDDNPESSVTIASSTQESGAVIQYGAVQSVSRISLLTDSTAKGTLEFFLVNDAPPAVAEAPADDSGSSRRATPFPRPPRTPRFRRRCRSKAKLRRSASCSMAPIPAPAWISPRWRPVRCSFAGRRRMEPTPSPSANWDRSETFRSMTMKWARTPKRSPSVGTGRSGKDGKDAIAEGPRDPKDPKVSIQWPRALSGRLISRERWASRRTLIRLIRIPTFRSSPTPAAASPVRTCPQPVIQSQKLPQKREPPRLAFFVSHFPLHKFLSIRQFRRVRRAIYPGSFDPITNGHLDVIERAARLFDEVIVAVAQNDQKKSLFTAEERMALIEGVLDGKPNVRVSRFDGLLVEFARAQGATAVLRGLRAVSDFEFEFQMALMNRKLEPGIETIFLMPAENYTYLSSRIVKEIARLGGNVTAFVPPSIATALREKFGAGSA